MIYMSVCDATIVPQRERNALKLDSHLPKTFALFTSLKAIKKQ